MYVYVAGPMMKPDRILNLRRGIDAADKIASKGHIVFVPHISEIWQLVHSHNPEFWLDQDFGWIKKCDILVRIPGYSSGADREEFLARNLNKIVFGSETIDGLMKFITSEYWDKI